MSSHPMLPAQYEVGTLGGGQPGEIMEEKPTVLGKLLVPPSDRQAKHGHVLPDPWSHTILFAMELGGRLPERKLTATQQWRGLMSLFALQQHRNLQLARHLVVLPHPDEGPRARRHGSRLLRSLSGLRPVGTLADKSAEWQQFELILLDRAVLGMIVPNTIVCPSRTSLGASADCPWIADGRLIDPLSADLLSSEETAVLERFCETALKHLDEVSRHSQRDQFLYTCLRGEFETLRREAHERLQHSPPHPWMAIHEITVPNPVATDPLLLLDYRAVMQFNSRHESGGCWSESVLELRHDLPAAERLQIILLDPPKEAFSRRPQDIKVWRHYSLEDVRRPETLQKVREEISVHGFLAVTTDDFFTPKLTEVVELAENGKRNALNQRLPKEFHGGARDYLLPLSPLALLVATPAQLVDGKTCEITGTAPEVQCRLAVRLKNIAAPVALSKTYASVLEVEAPANLAIWPDFHAADWRQYYILDAANVDLQRFMLGRPHTASTILEVLSQSEARYTTGVGSDLKKRKWCARADACKKEDYYPIFECRYLPEAFPALYTPNAFEDTPDNEILGLLVVPPALFSAPRFSGQKCKIGVDFGSTKSTVYWDAQQGDSNPLNFATRTVRLLRDAGNERPKEFLPSRDVDQPIMTAFRERDSRRLVDLGAPVVSGYIYFVDGLLRSLDALALELKGSGGGRNPTRFDLKWGRDGAAAAEHEAQRTRTTLFIEQLVLMCAAEAAARGIRLEDIAWCFGFPEAFRPRMRREFQSMVGQAVVRAGCPQQPSPCLLSESHAAGLYFLNPKVGDGIPQAQRSGHFVTIDIGGSTSDICIWQDKDILWRNSVRLAGSEMLIQPMTEGPGRLKLLTGLAKSGEQIGRQAVGLHEWLKTIDGVSTVRHLRSLVEMIIGSAEFADVFTQNINSPTVHFDAREQARVIEGFVGVVLGSLLYYIGMVIEVMKKDLRFQVRPKERLPIYIGGRGSLVCKRFVEGTNPELRGGLISLLLKTTPETFFGAELHYSGRPKHEVAHGCVLFAPEKRGDITGQSEAEDFDFLILGERAHTPQGKALGPEAKINAAAPDQHWELDYELPSLKTLLAHLRSRCDISIQHDDFPNIAGSVDEDTRKALAEGFIEPPFILAVRRLLADLALGHHGCHLVMN